MSKTQEVNIRDLKLDLKNFRTTPQIDESNAIHAMIAVNQNRFYAVIESLIDDEYIPTENIICQKEGKDLVVKEGNRRMAAMKLILGIHNPDDFQIPDSIKSKIAAVDKNWKNRNKSVPCSVYDSTETEIVDRIVALTHGKGDKASRDPWTSVARARHNRDVKNGKEDGLNLLEKYLEQGRNINAQQKERWAGDYGVTVLDEALRKIYSRLNYSSIGDLVAAYPKMSDRDKIEDIMLAIGLENLSFKDIRGEIDVFVRDYGFPELQNASVTNSQNGQQATTNGTSTTSTQNQTSSSAASTQTTTNQQSSTSGTATAQSNGTTTSTRGSKSSATNTPRHVKSLLKKFSPKRNRAKVVTLRDEMLNLKIDDTPLAFCFLLRSSFEISAKAYCDEHSLPTTVGSGSSTKEKTLAQLLTQVTNHLTANSSNQAMSRVLHGALVEITNPNRILSVTSMNQLVHNQSFSIAPPDVCTLFTNIYPLLEAMN